jgi:hypothetical protein
MNCPDNLKRRYREGRVLPFIGAGVSMGVSWEVDGEIKRGPSWTELVDQAIKILGFEDPKLARVRGTDLQILEYFKLKQSGEMAQLTNWLSQSMHPSNEDLKSSLVHSELAKLDKCNLFYTTNYDNFLERAFGVLKKPVRVVALEEQMGGVGEISEVIKFHGDLDHPSRIVLTESDYEKRLSLSTAMDYRLRSDILGRVLLFIGYSFRDPNVSYLFRLFSDHFLDQTGSLPGTRAYIVLPDPSDFEVRLFDSRKIEIIKIDGNSISEDTGSLLKEMRG